MIIRPKVKNVGAHADDEVVHLYLHHVVGSVTRSVEELKGSRRLILATGGQRLPCPSPYPWRIGGLRSRHALHHIVEPRQIEVAVGSASDDNCLTGQFEIVGRPTPIARKVFFSHSTGARLMSKRIFATVPSSGGYALGRGICAKKLNCSRHRAGHAGRVTYLYKL